MLRRNRRKHRKPKKRPEFQRRGFKTLVEYQKHQENAKIFQECLDESQHASDHRIRQRLDALDRIKYHNLRLQELAKG